MAVPTWIVGQVLTAADVNNWFVSPTGYKTAVTTRNTLTKAIDPDLQVILAASSIYHVQAGVIYTSLNAMDFTWTIPASATGGFTGAFNLAGTGAGTWGNTWGATVTAAGLSGSVNGIQVDGMISTAGTGGTFGFSWASSTGPVNCTVGVGSVLSVVKVG